jgi:hypothetical protein
MASNFEKGGKPGAEAKGEGRPKQQMDPAALRKALGSAAIKGAKEKK